MPSAESFDRVFILTLACATTAWSTQTHGKADMTYSSGSLVDPPAMSAISQAVGWIEATALGTLATIVAVIAVAAIGLIMLTGRLDLRRGATVIIGCFLIFGATTIAAGLSGGGGIGTNLAPGVAQGSRPPPLPSPTPMPQYDPYAGASVPR